MSTDQKQTEAHAEPERKQWPVSLIDCLERGEEQQSWPWFMFKALVCPATALGANETLFQEEEPADICCLQPRSVCGPTCRELNMQFCGLGNEGLKLCAHMCLLQAACSCMCLGLPLVAWLTALQRQRVVAKHSVDETGQDPWLTAALYPCSLLQMHALLQQQQQQHNQQCAGQAAAPYKAPRVQQMVAAECSSVSQAPSLPGPLTSAMSSSRVMRAVRTQSAKGPGSRLGDSISSDTSSGVVDNPYGQHQTEVQGEESVMCNLGDDIAEGLQQQQQQPDERQTTHLLEHCAGSSSTSRLPAHMDWPLHMGSTCLSARSTNSSKLASPRPSSRGGGSAPAGGAGVAAAIEQGPLSARRRLQQQQQHPQGIGAAGSTRAAGLPPKHRRSITGHPSRAASGNGGASTAGAGPPGPQLAHSPEPPHCTEVDTMFSQLQTSCSGRSSQGGVPTPALQSSGDVPAASIVSSSTLQHHRSKSAGAALSTVLSSCDNLSQGRLSYGASSAKLQLSQEDVPLMAIKPTPGRVPRGMSTGLSSSRGALGKGNVAGSWQRHSGSHGPVDASSVHGSRRGSDCGTGGAAAAAQHQMQFGTVQSDICNYASWLGGAEISTTNLHTGTAASGHTSRQQSMSQADSSLDNMDEQQVLAGPATGQKDAQRQQSLESQAGVGSDEEQLQPPSRQDSEVLLGSISAAKVSSSPVTLKNKAVSKASFAGPPSVQQSSSILQQGRSHARPGRARMSDWAYTSDICNLGGSFEANISTYGTGFAAALERLAEEGYDSTAEESGAPAAVAAAPGRVGSSATAAATGGRAAVLDSQQAKHQQRCKAPPASGSWPDANPSPPSTLHETLDSQPSSNNVAELSAAPIAAPVAASAECNSYAGSKQATAAQPASQQKQSGTEQNAQAASARDKAAAETAAPGTSGSGGANAGTTTGKRKPLSIDREMIAAVTGTDSTEQLTASQEELAAKLAKLAFANPAAAGRLAGQRPQQQQDMEHAAAAAAGNTGQAWADCVDGDEPFYPTMMSDMCNLAEPLSDEDEMQQAENDGTARLLSAAAAASVAQQSVLKSVQQGLVTTAAQRRLQLQQRQSQNRQQRLTAGRLVGAAGASRAGSVAVGAGAGPLKSALLMRGAPQAARRPGMAKQAGSAASSAAATGGSPADPAARASAVNGANSCFTLESFDSYYPDCDIKCSVDAPPNSKGRTFTVTPGGVIIETPGLTQFASGGSSNSSRAASPATAGGMVSTGVGSSPPKSPKRRAAAAAAGQHANSALQCESASASAAESDVQSGWHADVSRGTSPAAGMSAEAAAAMSRSSAAAAPSGGGVGLKGLLGIASVQTSNSLWPVVDASAVVRSGQH